ncbi:uncharacterized protein BT62DRAFT_1003814 [Guyanagaster necrorhizus]|uniref:Monopolin complex subunit Csm1/Pcs1 C-terminal domain-containing protein n=1 Tax=Guyanagaster necrorhizus TaxID=856835 RepID=A0A9P8AU26_9AGAR|nr:uncharacterized protein BT62DRAFT_1003814 [Guyanagaster necrorhizus MCA 3950]KAG7448039.1 hypothetical protein BT62DRAFT_1003814 [Guyanagaster necrorhizus MCA 3950]
MSHCVTSLRVSDKHHKRDTTAHASSDKGMSDDSLDLGGLGPTTPAANSRMARAAQGRSAVAGPSRPISKAGRQKKDATPSSSGDEGHPVVVPDDDDTDDNDGEESVTEVVARKPQTARRGRKPGINGMPRVKRKGKAKAASPKMTQPLFPEVLDDSEDDRAVQVAAVTNSAIDGNSGSEMKRLRRELVETRDSANKYSKQLEELFAIRHTEPERLLVEYRKQSDSKMEAQDAIIRELTSNLAKKEPLMREGKTSMLHLMTREAVDEEKETLERDVQRYKGRVEVCDRDLKEKDKRILEQDQTIKDLRIELQAEIDRANALAKDPRRPPGSAQRSRGQTILGAQEPKHGATIQFYEDVTNLLITNVRNEKCSKRDKEEDWILTCIYTYVDEDSPGDPDSNGKSLNFNLRLCHELAEGNEYADAVLYSPLELDKEPEDFVQQLDFLSGPFTFPRRQLPVFIRTINNTIGKTMQEEGEEEGEGEAAEDDDVQMVE